MSISNWLAAATSKAMPVRGGEMGEEVLTRGQHIVVRSAEEIKRQTVTSKLSCFLFSSSRTGTFEFNSTTSCSRAPRRRAGRAAWPRRFADGRGRLAAVGAADDVFSADEFSEGDDSIGYQFRMLDEIGGLADNTRNQDLPGGRVPITTRTGYHPRFKSHNFNQLW